MGVKSWFVVVYCVVLALLPCQGEGSAPVAGFRPPAVPLINWDPYMNIYSFSDKLTDSWPVLWTGTVKAFVGMLRIDGVAYRFMGPQSQDGGTLPDPMDQISVKVYPTQTEYIFSKAGVQLTLTFTTPKIAESTYDYISRPITYLQYKSRQIINNIQ
ncbi:hypothetical protein Pelo_2994 [Pelomyxa schiedti]|nr:hypothetical protein Pelo_2994 [Pelomyxa schiedti]